MNKLVLFIVCFKLNFIVDAVIYVYSDKEIKKLVKGKVNKWISLMMTNDNNSNAF